MIELKNLSAGYDGQPILKDIDLSFPDASITVLLGPNGCGKSTLCDTILGQLPAIAGTVLLDKDDCVNLSITERARRLAYLAQSPSVPNLTARRMVLHGRFPYLSYPRKYSHADLEKVDNALKSVNAMELADRPMTELSGGERQRVRFAMLLAQDTNNVIMDEPTTFLDIRYQLEFAQLANELSERGKAVILVLHDIGLAMRLADRIVLLGNGGVAGKGTPEEVFQSGKLEELFGIKLGCFTADGRKQYYFI